ncbi:MAG: undecaprenyl-phosphate glucose phosphotransferase [Thermoanaerobaculia bacterium]|nr:undecaprenyl-phosphate glucose phosphotransferase [Thermoanaerobaculia bacterium]
MLRRHNRIAATLYMAGDLVATLVAFALAWYLRFEVDLLPGSSLLKGHVPELGRYLRLLPFVMVLWPVVFHFHGLYKIRRTRTRADESLTLIVAVALATVLLSVVLTWYRLPGYVRADGVVEQFTYSRSFLALFAVLNLLAVGAARYLIRGAIRQARARGFSTQRILVAGAGALGVEVTRKIQAHREFGFEVIGFLDDDPAKSGATILGAPVLGTLDDVETALEKGSVDQIYVALPPEAHRKTLQLLQVAARECVDAKLVPDILQYATLKAAIEDLDGIPVINLSEVPLEGWSSLVKRAMDLTLALAALVGLLPFLPFVALAIWLEDRGPIFYRQERMGLDGRPFMILKLRSMRVGAEDTTGPVWAVRDDPRRTRVGSFLRRWSLDELPQIWNVLMGEMSIVGPRPERPAFVHEFKNRMPQYMLRHRVKSGITGWAQVHGWRGNTSIKKRLQYDLYYIENWSLGLDVKILWMTLRHGLRVNAY